MAYISDWKVQADPHNAAVRVLDNTHVGKHPVAYRLGACGSRRTPRNDKRRRSDHTQPNRVCAAYHSELLGRCRPFRVSLIVVIVLSV